MQLTWSPQINLHGKQGEDPQVHVDFAGLHIFIPTRSWGKKVKSTCSIQSAVQHTDTEQRPVLAFYYSFFFSTFLQTAPIAKVLKLTNKLLEFTQMWAFYAGTKFSIGCRCNDL